MNTRKVPTVASLLLVVFASLADATTTICEEDSSSESENLLVVRVPDERYAEFVQLIESGDIVPVSKRFKHTGGVESDRSKWWALKSSDYSVGVYVDYFKQSKEFVFWVQTCNTTDTWQPYWRALNARVRAFPEAEVQERSDPKR